MAAAINLLPWRQSRRNTCLRLWRVLFSGSLLLIVGCALSLCSVFSAENRAESVLLDGEHRRADALLALKPRLQQRQDQWLRVLQRKKQRDQTRRWRLTLEGLANLLPEQAWLTKITWQQDTLELTGNTLSVGALEALDARLHQQALFQPGRPGETQQDAQGRWQFTYRLTASATHDGPL